MSGALFWAVGVLVTTALAATAAWIGPPWGPPLMIGPLALFAVAWLVAREEWRRR